MNYLGLTEDQFKRFDRACHATWQTIGGDIMACRDEFGRNGAIPRAEVVEVVLDADYMRMYGEMNHRAGPNGPDDWTTFYDTVLRDWISKHYDTKPFKALMRKVFQSKWYA